MKTGRLNVQPYSDLHTPETGNHQDQVKVLIEKTASSLDDTALRMLFVSVQQNNIDLCIQSAIYEYVMFSYCWGKIKQRPFSAWLNRSDSFIPSVVIAIYVTVRLNLIQEDLTFSTMLWFGHSFVSRQSIHGTGVFTPLRNSYQWVPTQFVSTCHLWKLSYR